MWGSFSDSGFFPEPMVDLHGWHEKTCAEKENLMARKPNYDYQKRQKELARKAKKEEKKKKQTGGGGKVDSG